MQIGIIGAGAIAEVYVWNFLNRVPGVQLCAISSKHMDSARRLADKYALRACSVEELLTLKEIELVVVLTPVETHYAVIRQALQAGKHVYTEKTLAADTKQAADLLAFAKQMNRRLGCAPDTFLGQGLQTALGVLERVEIGTVHSFSIGISRCNDYLTAILPFLRHPLAGALRDYTVYYLTALIAMLGPVERVCAFVDCPVTQRVNRIEGTRDYGQTIETPAESVIAAMLRLESGVTGTIAQNHESIAVNRADFAIYGTSGMLLPSDPDTFEGESTILRADYDGNCQRQIPERLGLFAENSRGLGVSDMVYAIRQGREMRCDARLAYHVLEVIEAFEQSARCGQVIAVRSRCARPAPMPGAI